MQLNYPRTLAAICLVLLAGCPAASDDPTDPGGGDGTTPPPASTTCSLGNTCNGAQGSEPAALATADFNKDNLPDLAVVNSGTNVLSILTNQGNGTLADTRDIATGDAPSAVVAADLDGDGTVDLAVTSGSGISVYRNTGGGTFEAARNFATGTAASALIAADVDGDSRPELITANPLNNNISILRNLGSMNFASAVNTGVGRDPSALLAVDLTGDGRVEIVTANRGDNTISVMRNQNGILLGPTNPPVGVRPTSVAAGNFNGDLRMDLVVTNEGQFSEAQADTATILLGNGNATFAAPQTVTVGVNPQAVTVSDLNLDGRPDLAIANYGIDASTSTVAVLLGNGNGTFAAPVLFAAGTGPVALATADLDGNDRPDLMVANFAASSLSLLSNTGNQVFAPQQP